MAKQVFKRVPIQLSDPIRRSQVRDSPPETPPRVLGRAQAEMLLSCRVGPGWEQDLYGLLYGLFSQGSV
jgi:hypothetical protein